MSNYDTDRLDRDDKKDIKGIVKSSKPTQQWDAQEQAYVEVGNDQSNIKNVLRNSPRVQSLVEVIKDRPRLEKEEVTNPKHYDKVGFAIQPIEYITKNELDFLEGNVIKYVSRYQHKGGVNDLLKARTYIEFLITREREKNG